MNQHSYKKGTVPCRTWRMLMAMEEDLFFKRPAVPGRRPPIVLPEALCQPVTVSVSLPSCSPEGESSFDRNFALWGQELEALYRTHIQGDLAAWDALLSLLREQQEARPSQLKHLDRLRAEEGLWFARRDLLAMGMDPAAFAGSPAGVAEHLDYLETCGVSLLRLTGCGREALAVLAEPCRSRSISLCVTLPAPVDCGPQGFYAWVEELLILANLGADAICLDALAQLPADTVRMARLICQLVCPGVLLTGSGPAACFGTPEKPLCHLLFREGYAPLWHTLATEDVALLRHETDLAAGQPKEQLYLNALQGGNGLAWNLDYGWLHQHCGTDEQAHRQYLNDWFTGNVPGGNSRAERCREGRICGTTASLCGVEAADYEQNDIKLNRAIACDQLLHAWLLTQSGLPLLISGDELGQLNDYSFHDDSARAGDARNLLKGSFQWELAAMCGDAETRQGKQFQGLRRLAQLRADEPAFDARANVWTFDTGNPHVLGLGRWYEGRKLIALFNFSHDFVTAGAPEGGAFEELVYGGHYDTIGHVELYPYGFVWLLQH